MGEEFVAEDERATIPPIFSAPMGFPLLLTLEKGLSSGFPSEKRGFHHFPGGKEGFPVERKDTAATRATRCKRLNTRLFRPAQEGEPP